MHIPVLVYMYKLLILHIVDACRMCDTTNNMRIIYIGTLSHLTLKFHNDTFFPHLCITETRFTSLIICL